MFFCPHCHAGSPSDCTCSKMETPAKPVPHMTRNDVAEINRLIQEHDRLRELAKAPIYKVVGIFAGMDNSVPGSDELDMSIRSVLHREANRIQVKLRDEYRVNLA